MKRMIPLILLSFLTCLSAEDDDRLKLEHADVYEYTTVDSMVVQQFRGNVVFSRNDMQLNTDVATYYENVDEMHLTGFVRMTDEADTLNCGILIFYNENGMLKAWENVTFQQADQVILCDTLFYWTEADSGLAVNHVKMSQPGRNVNTDHFTYFKTDGFRGSSFEAAGNTIVVDDDRLISARRIQYNDVQQRLLLEDEGSVSDPTSGLSGQTIDIQYADSILQSIEVTGESFAYSDLEAKTSPGAKTKQLFRDNMSATSLHAGFEHNQLAKLTLMGMATTEYHVVQDTVLQGSNTATGDTICVHFAEDEMKRIQVFGGGRGLFTPEGANSTVRSEVKYTANYLDYDLDEMTSILQEDAIVSYEGMELTAGFITADWSTNILSAETVDGVAPTITSLGNEPMSGEYMAFNLLTKHGRVLRGKTRFNDGNYYGTEVYRDEPETYHVDQSVYTTCDNENPHFCFASRRMKMITDDKVIARPMILYIFDLPVFALPFGVFPNKGGGRHSGWIMPNFGTTSSSGTFIQGLGYYWAPNEYVDGKLRFNFRDRKGVDLNGIFNYKLRYKFNGKITATMFREILSEDIADIFSKQVDQQYRIKWTHSQTIDPTQRISIEANYVSSNTINQDFGWDLKTRLDQRMVSKANYTKSWIGTKNNMTVNLQEDYDLMASRNRPDELSRDPGETYVERTRKVPGITFSHGQSQLLGNGKKSNWYHDIMWSYNSRLNSNQKVNLVAETDSTWLMNREYDRQTTINHSFTLSSPQTLFGWLTLNPNMAIWNDWAFKHSEALLDTTGVFAVENGVIQYREVEQFRTRTTGKLALSMNTKIYGVFPMEVGKLTAIRHVMTPSISLNWKPDFSKPLFGADLDYFQEDAEGELFDRFTNSGLSGTTRSESQTIGLSLNNEFQAKTRNGEDSYQKLNILTWRLNSSYNALADSLKLAVIRSSIRANIPGGLNLDITMTHDPYELKLLDFSDDPAVPNYQYTRVDQFSALPRLTSVSASTSFQFSGGRFTGFEEAATDTNSVVEDLDELYTDSIDKPAPSMSSGTLWKANFSVRYSLNKSVSGDEIKTDRTFWVNARLGINLTENWKLDYSARFDMEDNELVSHSFDIYRSLHCWEFRFQWWPSGAGSGFRLLINVKNPDLKDIKLKSTGGSLNRLW